MILFTSVVATVIAAAPGIAQEMPRPDIAGWKTALFGVLLLSMILMLALEEKIHAKKSVITSVFAVVAVLLGSVLGCLPFREFGEVYHALPHLFGEGLPIYIPAINWEVIVIILASTIFVDATSRSGVFTWIAIKLTKKSGGDPLRLLIFYSVMTVIFSAVLNNVTAMIIVGSLTGVSLGKLGRQDKLLGFLLIEGLLTNVGGLLTLISSVPNIIVGNTAGISFLGFFIFAAPYVLVTTVITIWMGKVFFKIAPLTDEKEKEKARSLVASFDENDGIPSRRFFYFSAVVSVLMLVAFASASVIPYVRDLGLGFVAAFFAVVMMAAFKSEVDKVYAAVDWDLIAFFVSLFVVINVMEHAQVLALLGRGIEALAAQGGVTGMGSLLWTSAIASAVTDNIPLSAMLAKILSQIPEAASSSDSPLWWAVIFGANLGGNITPIGSASTVVAVTVMHRNKVPISFLGFVKVAAPYAVIQLILATIYVAVLKS